MDDFKNLEIILQEVRNLSNKYDEISNLTGENFNVFDIIGLRNNEVKMHSAMLAELLNVRGSHGMKGKFLELFLDMLKINTFMIDLDNSTCEVEKYIGVKSELEGGRIDIYISDSNGNALIVENKIHAIEQENQLIRYRNFQNKAPIVFLSLNGKEPKSKRYTTNKGELIELENVYLCSYQIEIINWLEKCKKEVYDKPVILYAIKQYQVLIKLLTNQSNNKLMEDKIVNFLVEKNLLSEYFRLKSFNEGIERRVTSLYFEKILDKNIIIPDNIGDKESIIIIKSWDFNLETLELGFWFDSRYDNLYLFFSAKNQEKNYEFKALFSSLSSLDLVLNKPWVIAEMKFEFFNNISWESLLSIENLDMAKEKVNSVILELDSIMLL